MVRWISLGCLFGALLVLSGCGPAKAVTTKISGTVELDGKPLDDGRIDLAGEAGTAPESFPIKNGKFEGQATLGKKKVSIMAFKESKPATMGDKVLEGTGGKENYLPARFNTESTIPPAEVTASGLSPSDFKVEKE